MSTPCTSITCRMKHLISCFNACCKVPIEQEGAESDHQKPIGDDRKREREESAKIETTKTAERGGGGGEESPASWQSCESEENDNYIVFYFKEDDSGIDVIEERVLDTLSERKPDAAGRRNNKEIQFDAKMSHEHRDALGDSTGSSTSSFAFPTIEGEWTGSPVLMPRPERYKNKSGGVWIQCCKF